MSTARPRFRPPRRLGRPGRPAVPLRTTFRGASITAAEARQALAKKAQPEPGDAAELVEQIEADYQFAFVKRVILAHLAVAPISCTAEDETDERATVLAAYLLDLWQRHLDQIATSEAYGRAAFAVEWEFDDETGLHRPKLHSMPFRECSPKWHEDTGEFLGIEILGGDELLLKPPQCWHCPTDADALHPHGKSRYLGAAREEFDRRCELFRLWSRFVRKFALSGGLAYGPDKFRGANNEETDAADAVKGAWEALDMGALLYLKGERDQNGNWPIEVMRPPTLDPPAPISDELKESDVRVLRARGLSELSVQQTGDLGSYALAVVHRLVTLSVVYELAGQWGGSFARYVVAPAAKFNFGRESAITFDTPKLTSLADSAMTDLAKAILATPTINPILAALDIKRILEGAGVPVPDDFEQKLAREVAAQKQLTALGNEFGSLGSGASTVNVDSRPEAAAMAESLLDQRLDPNATPEGTPSLDAFWADVMAEIADIFNEITDILATRPDTAWSSPQLRELLERADLLIEDAGRAANLIGRAAVPVSESPRRLAGPVAVAMEGDDRTGPKWRWPWMERLTDWLQRRRLLTPDEYRALPTADRSRNVSLPSVSSPETLSKLRSKLAEVIAEGLPPREFRRQVKEIATVPRHQAETLVRTVTKQSYLDGKTETLEKPHVSEAFPFVLLVTTRDTRVRDTHKPMDGLIVKVGSPAYAKAKRLMSEYQCRCDMISLSAERARSEANRSGRRMVDDLPAEAEPRA